MAEQTTEDLLTAYGYSEISDGLFVRLNRPASERWISADGDGWYCYAPETPGIAGGDPWGDVIPGGLMRVPYRQTEAFKEASGLHPARNPECFEWIWPDERVHEIYAHAAAAEGNEWRKTDEGDFVKD